MERIAFLLVFKHARVGCAELCLVKSLAEAFACLGHLFFYFFLIFGYLVFNENISAITFFGIAVVDQRIIEGINVSGSLPNGGMHKHCRINAHNIFVEQHHRLPPILLDVVFQFYAVLAVIVNGSQAVVNIT